MRDDLHPISAGVEQSESQQTQSSQAERYASDASQFLEANRRCRSGGDRCAFVSCSPAAPPTTQVPSPAAPPAIPDAVPVVLNINGKQQRLTLDPRTTLLDALRENLNMFGTKKGCDHGQCGACTVHVNGRR